VPGTQSIVVVVDSWSELLHSCRVIGERALFITILAIVPFLLIEKGSLPPLYTEKPCQLEALSASVP
jgi:hypothetical protein